MKILFVKHSVDADRADIGVAIDQCSNRQALPERSSTSISRWDGRALAGDLPPRSPAIQSLARVSHEGTISLP
jgi:hypothetical protein